MLIYAINVKNYKQKKIFFGENILNVSTSFYFKFYTREFSVILNDQEPNGYE